MRTADEFNAYYKSPDPWGIAAASRRDRALKSIIAPYIAGKSVLELGCGEGHLTAQVFSNAKSVRGIDISPVAISRATARLLPNATFEVSDFLNVAFSNYDVVVAIECLYYLSLTEQELFFRKLAHEHAGKTFILSAPIIGSNEYRTYYTHAGMEQTFSRYGIVMMEWRNLNANRKAGIGAMVASIATRLLPGGWGDVIVNALPEKWVYQRCYISRCPS